MVVREKERRRLEWMGDRFSRSQLYPESLRRSMKRYRSCPPAHPKQILAFPSTAHRSHTLLLHAMQAVSRAIVSSSSSIPPSDRKGSSQSSHLMLVSVVEWAGGSRVMAVSVVGRGTDLGIRQKAWRVLRCGCSAGREGRVGWEGAGSACGCCFCAANRREIVFAADGTMSVQPSHRKVDTRLAVQYTSSSSGRSSRCRFLVRLFMSAADLYCSIESSYVGNDHVGL